MVKVVVTRPNHDYATGCGYSALERVNEYFFLRGYQLVDLPGEQAVRENVLRELPASLFYGVGHGIETVFMGWENTTIFYYCDCRELAGSLVYLLSCLTAKELGYDIVEKGARAYIGYNVEFTWVVDDYDTCYRNPYEDRYCKWFFNPVRVLLERIADGKTMGEAQQASIDEWNEGIRYWTENPENDPWASYVLYWLVWDRDGQVLYGDPNARLVPVTPFNASVSSSYEVTATIYDIALEAPVTSSYEARASVGVKKRTTWYYYIPAFTAVSVGLTREAEERRKWLIAGAVLGAGTYLYLYLTRPRPKPYVPPGIVLQTKVVSEYKVRAVAKPPLVLQPSTASSYDVRSMVVAAIRVEASVASSYEVTATAAPAIPIEATEEFSSTTEARVGLERAVVANEDFSSTTMARITMERRLEASVSSSYTVLVDITRVVPLRPFTSSSYVDTATVGVSATVSATEEFSSTTEARVGVARIEVRPSVISSYAVTATLEVKAGLTASVASSYVDTATVTGTIGVSVAESFASSVSASVTTAPGLVAYESFSSSLSAYPFLILESTTVNGVLSTDVDCPKLISISAMDAYVTYECVDGKVVVYTYDVSVSGESWSLNPDGTLSHVHGVVPKDTTVRLVYLP